MSYRNEVAQCYYQLDKPHKPMEAFLRDIDSARSRGGSVVKWLQSAVTDNSNVVVVLTAIIEFQN